MNSIERLSNSVSNNTILSIRTILFLVAFGWVLWRLSIAGWSYFFFLTSWNWILCSFGFLCGIIYTLAVNNQWKSKTLFRMLHIAMLAIVSTISWIVCLGFWALLNSIVFGKDVSFQTRWTQTFSHSINLILAMIDLFASNTNLKFIHVVYPIGAVLGYQALVLVGHGGYGTKWPYSFMAKVNGGEDGINWMPMVMMGAAVVVACVIMYGLCLFLIKIRNRLFPDGKTRASSVVEVVV
ncbi:hypothetical protein BC833DRAFT_649189 [Globomyces pollinis-pini]|nr:hypothetical protein BC833DRAFT_649189 [Globomyces pollinis-pini]